MRKFEYMLRTQLGKAKRKFKFMCLGIRADYDDLEKTIVYFKEQNSPSYITGFLGIWTIILGARILIYNKCYEKIIGIRDNRYRRQHNVGGGKNERRG